MSEHTSYSELNTLAECERKWWYRYLHREERTQTVQQFRGSALHDLIGAWRQGDERPAVDRLNAAVASGQVITVEEMLQIEWLFDRYKRYYGGHRPRIVATEFRVENKLPGTDLSVLTYVDEIEQTETGLWAVERKSMKDWQRMNLLDVDPQVTITVWNLRQDFPTLKGVLYDAIRTYRFVDSQPTLGDLKSLHAKRNGETVKTYTDRMKRVQHDARTEAPLEDSFRRQLLTRTEQEIEGALNEIYAGVTRVEDLKAGRRPIRNLGRHCDWCDHKLQCWADLQFGEVQ